MAPPPTSAAAARPPRAPLSEAVIAAVTRLVDDAQVATRLPSHSTIDGHVRRAGLAHADPYLTGERIGKAKRVRAALYHALEFDVSSGERYVATMIGELRGCGGFREDSPNFCGRDAIQDAVAAFKAEGFDLGSDGDLRPIVLDGLVGKQMTEALHAYVRRAKRGAEDAALLAGTGKDLVEAVAKHVLVERFGSSPQTRNFPTLLGQAYVALGLTYEKANATTPQTLMDAALYDLACAVNKLRNAEGTGHGRPFLPTLTPAEARSAVESMGLVAARLLAAL